MARSKRAGSKKTRKRHDGPHWGVLSVPGYQADGGDTWWYLVYGKTQRRERIGRGSLGMREASREADRRNAKALSRIRKSA